MRTAVIIPSRSLANLVPCVDAIRHHEPEMPIVVVTDGGMEHKSLGPILDFVPGAQPFVFARNINIGMLAASEMYDPEAFILLNDDALLQTPGGFTALGEEAEARPDYGIIASVTNSAGNPNQFSRGAGFREEPRMVCFVCVLITAAAFFRIGVLDEQFTAYGWEDNDYCRRARAAGLKIGISERCFVDHLCLKSTFRGDPRSPANITDGAAIYQRKWGDLG